MPSLAEIRTALADSSPYDWNRIAGWGANAAPVGPALTSVMSTGEYGEVEGWYSRNYSDLLVWERDVVLSIGYGLKVDPEEKRRLHFDWAEKRNWEVTNSFADIRWHGQVVDRMTMWSIDKGSALVPIGDFVPEGQPRYIEPWQYAVAFAIAVAHGNDSQLDYYLSASEQSVRMQQ
ncbi:hypothetical protein SAMN05660209_03029 [Geodermatophilus africanus]|uniref:Uncharacterized protein n=1 Tax=Geodermatophilus africanus TaxID=1137993 RepID=A0A1H3KD58_9ACTN|nr:hypothetical protein [Geodermatophilus africanus]SDY49879.1 hypothetical protein SAMN05660209_03029 [Geodermatophilus africanus]